MLDAMSSAKRFNQWMADTLLPFISGDVLELGAGIGNLTTLLCSGAGRYVATDLDNQALTRLRARVEHWPNVTTAECDIAKASDFERFRDSMDTVVCLNVLEHVEDDVTALRSIHSCLKPGGRAVILVPQGMQVFGSLDEVLEHLRRYSTAELHAKMTAAGFHVERILKFNRMTYLGWFLNSRILRRRTLSRMQLRVFELLVPVWRRIDRFLPWPPTSIIGIGIRES
jgi:2-polyprenyl-3-methyl-5-hydroxy-6-metoxy-1,4-benzoquinol methylase